MNHSEFNSLLQRRFRAQEKVPRRVRLPSDGIISFGGDVRQATLRMTERAITANMQTDSAAFESWAVVLMAWCGVQQVAINWDEPTDTMNRHYQRFLYRLGKFEELLGPEVVHLVGRERLAQCRVGNGAAATLNVAGSQGAAVILSPPGSEAHLEKRLTERNSTERARLCAKFDLIELDRQVPVGVFDGPPKRANAIFTGGKSAIDLVGLGRNDELWLFELKTAQNIKVGALSELFFYSMVLLDAHHRRIAFHDKPAGQRSTITPTHVIETPRIHARVLAESFHPLLSTTTFDILNEAAAARGWAVDYGFENLTCYLDKTANRAPTVAQ